MTPIWTPDSILFLVFVALAIAFLLLGETIEARRGQPVAARRDIPSAARATLRLRALPKAARAALNRGEAAATMRSLAVD